MIRAIFLTVMFFFAAINTRAYDDHGMRDPFWPLVSSSGTIINYGQDVSVSDMILEGIVSNGQGAYTVDLS